jgi:hypothetical protein
MLDPKALLFGAAHRSKISDHEMIADFQFNLCAPIMLRFQRSPMLKSLAGLKNLLIQFVSLITRQIRRRRHGITGSHFEHYHTSVGIAFIVCSQLMFMLLKAFQQ